jgi:hypothetical protein
MVAEKKDLPRFVAATNEGEGYASIKRTALRCPVPGCPRVAAAYDEDRRDNPPQCNRTRYDGTRRPRYHAQNKTAH